MNFKEIWQRRLDKERLCIIVLHGSSLKLCLFIWVRKRYLGYLNTGCPLPAFWRCSSMWKVSWVGGALCLKAEQEIIFMGISILFKLKTSCWTHLNTNTESCFSVQYWFGLLLEGGDFILGTLSVFVSIIMLKWQATRAWQKTRVCTHVYVPCWLMEHWFEIGCDDNSAVQLAICRKLRDCEYLYWKEDGRETM